MNIKINRSNKKGKWQGLWIFHPVDPFGKFLCLEDDLGYPSDDYKVRCYYVNGNQEGEQLRHKF
jgi:hypothetical protein